MPFLKHCSLVAHINMALLTAEKESKHNQSAEREEPKEKLPPWLLNCTFMLYSIPSKCKV